MLHYKYYLDCAKEWIAHYTDVPEPTVFILHDPPEFFKWLDWAELVHKQAIESKEQSTVIPMFGEYDFITFAEMLEFAETHSITVAYSTSIEGTE